MVRIGADWSSLSVDNYLFQSHSLLASSRCVLLAHAMLDSFGARACIHTKNNTNRGTPDFGSIQVPGTTKAVIRDLVAVFTMFSVQVFQTYMCQALSASQAWCVFFGWIFPFFCLTFGCSSPEKTENTIFQ